MPLYVGSAGKIATEGKGSRPDAPHIGTSRCVYLMFRSRFLKQADPSALPRLKWVVVPAWREWETDRQMSFFWKSTVTLHFTHLILVSRNKIASYFYIFLFVMVIRKNWFTIFKVINFRNIYSIKNRQQISSTPTLQERKILAMASLL